MIVHESDLTQALSTCRYPPIFNKTIRRAFVLENAHYERIDHSFFVVRNHFAMFKMEGTENRE